MGNLSGGMTSVLWQYCTCTLNSCSSSVIQMQILMSCTVNSYTGLHFWYLAIHRLPAPVNHWDKLYTNIYHALLVKTYSTDGLMDAQCYSDLLLVIKQEKCDNDPPTHSCSVPLRLITKDSLPEGGGWVSVLTTVSTAHSPSAPHSETARTWGWKWALQTER